MKNNTGIGIVIGVFAFWLMSVLLSFGLIGLIIWAAIHFISKFW